MAVFLWYYFLMGVIWTKSSAKHGVSREDALWAMAHAEGSTAVEGNPGWLTKVWVGHPHPQTDRYIEVMGARRGDEFVIFHAMPLSDLYRHLIS